MTMDLSPQFHGTSADLHPGDRVLPRNRLQGVDTNWGGMRTVEGKSVDSMAFSTTDESTAWKFANHAADVNPGGRTSVARVNPHPEQRKGIFHEDHIGPGGIPGETVAPHFDVADRIDVRPGQQGTFPLNWNQFAKKGKTTIEDGFNHPTDENIESGHPGGKMYKAALAKNWGLEDLMDEPDDEPTHKQEKLF